MRGLAVAILAVAILTLPRPAAATRHLDILAVDACATFGRAMRDVGKGLLTEGELRAAIQQTYKSARLSRTPGVEAPAAAMLREVTAGDLQAFMVHARVFTDRCK